MSEDRKEKIKHIIKETPLLAGVHMKKLNQLSDELKRIHPSKALKLRTKAENVYVNSIDELMNENFSLSDLNELIVMFTHPVFHKFQAMLKSKDGKETMDTINRELDKIFTI